MASRSKRQKFKAFIRNPFSSKKNGVAGSSDAPNDTPTPSITAHSSSVIAATVVDEPSPSTGAPKATTLESTNQVPAQPGPSGQVPGIHTSLDGGILNNASGFTINNPIMVDKSANMTVYIGSDQRSKAMELLSKHTIHGAARDSSARSPAPKCHPGTRVEINEHIITWFYNEEKQELIIWVYGPAGVGKSAIMQTLADKLAESKHLGASVFTSRSNGRNSSRHLFLTVGYQLAVHIEEYCTYIAEKLARDPELVDKGMAEQFKILIVEPFVERKIGTGSKPLGILLDGLDELDERRSQKEIICLVANFVLKHPDVPLLWAIASRPEPHICDTFDEEEVIPAHWKKHVPANSKKSRQDVKRFLRDNLERIRKEFPRTVPQEWPNEEQFSSLCASASGLFIFADTAIRFIEDPRYANPIMRLNQVLSALNGIKSTSHNQPFAHLDALYTSILRDIPAEVWPTTKRVLGALLYAKKRGGDILKKLRTISIVLGIDLNTVYASLNGCYSLLKLSDPKDPPWKTTTFYHASFSDYLLDLTRSQSFCISLTDVEQDLLKTALNLWREFKANYCRIPGLTYEDKFLEYFSAFSSYDGHELRGYIHTTLMSFLVDKHNPKGVAFSSKEDQDLCFYLLHELKDSISSDFLNNYGELWPWLCDLCEVYQDELVSQGVIWAGKLEQIQFYPAGTRPVYMLFYDHVRIAMLTYHVPKFHEILHHISRLKLCFPQLPTLAFGSLGNGYLFFRHQVNASDLEFYGIDHELHPTVFQYLFMPFSDSCSHHDAEHFLKTGFEAIQSKYSLVVPPTWPSKEQFLKLTSAVAHYFPFAHIALQFIRDPHSADPTTHLNQLLTIIDEVDASDNQPFIYVDALYTHILNSISPEMWPTTQQVLGVLLNSRTFLHNFLKCPRGISMLFGIKLSVVHAALKDCHLMVLIPPKKCTQQSITFCHTSFCEYLMDPARSKKFYVSKDPSLKMLYNTWQDFQRQYTGISGTAKWFQYHYPDAYLAGYLKHDLLQDVHEALAITIQYGPAELESKQTQDQVFYVLSQLDFFTISRVQWNRHSFVIWLFAIWKTYQTELTSRGLFREIEFQKLRLKDISCDFSHTLSRSVDGETKIVVGKNPKEGELKEYICGLQLFQQHRPQLPVLIGGKPGGRFAVFEYEYTEDDLGVNHDSGLRKLELGDRGYYVLLYPDEV